MNLKELIEGDIDDVFLNEFEFAEEVSFEGNNVLAVLEELPGVPYSGQKRAGRAEGVYGRSVSLYMRTPDPLPIVDKRVVLNGERWTVRKVASDSGMTLFLLEAVDS